MSISGYETTYYKKSFEGSLSHTELGNTGMQGEVVCPTELVLSASYHYSYDRQGNTLSDGENQYRYYSLNRLTEIKTQNGDLQKNRYDGEGLRAELEENGELTRFLYSGRDVVAEQDEKNNTVRYVRGLELLSLTVNVQGRITIMQVMSLEVSPM